MAGSPARAGARRLRDVGAPARTRRSRLRTNLVCNLITYAVWATYLAAGVAVAGSHGYLDGLGSPHPVVSAVAAVLLWPLVYLR